jgi:hypothetical protein
MKYACKATSMVQIWNAVAGNNPFLSKQQFYTAMRLVSAAQASGTAWNVVLQPCNAEYTSCCVIRTQNVLAASHRSCVTAASTFCSGAAGSCQKRRRGPSSSASARRCHRPPWRAWRA